MSDRPLAGIGLMVATTFVFAVQDGFSRHLAGDYSTMMVVMIRYWFFAVFVIAFSATRRGGLAAAIRTRRPVLQACRGVLLAMEIVVAVQGFVLIGLVASHAVFAIYPLLVVALSGPMLGETIGWWRRAAVAAGFVGVLIILAPSEASQGWANLIPFASALMFALYQILTRLAARTDSSQTSFFYTGVAGAITLTVLGLPYLEPMTPTDSLWMGALCISGALGHFLLIKALELAPASTLQPFSYLHPVFASAMGLVIFGEALGINTMIGASLIVCTGLFALYRERLRR